MRTKLSAGAWAGPAVFTFAVVTVGVFKEGINLSHIDNKTYR